MTSEIKLKSYAVLFTLAKDWRANVDRFLKNTSQEGITRCGLTIVVGGYRLDDKEQLRGAIVVRWTPSSRPRGGVLYRKPVVGGALRWRS